MNLIIFFVIEQPLETFLNIFRNIISSVLVICDRGLKIKVSREAPLPGRAPFARKVCLLSKEIKNI